MRIQTVVLAVSVVIGLAACKKNKDTSDPGNPTTPTSDAVKDSSLLYARDIYLWYKNIPSTFNAQSYSDPDAIMEAIRQYSSEPGFTGPVDRWSFGMKQTDWDNLSSGVGGDFGMGVFFWNSNDLRVSYTERESPAGKAGIHRSWRIKSINGNSNITTSNADFIVNAVYSSSSSTFVFTKPSGTDTTITLASASYKEHPVFLDSVYTTGSTKTGYLVFNSFLGDTTEITNEFARVFNKFNAQNVQDVIVDLRYNGGGFVSLQAALANYLVPSAGNNGVMETQAYNDKYSQFNETTNFRKNGTLNLNRIFFIVSQNTASASELLINSLKPYLNVQLVGPSHTHGKPVGFFPIPVGDWYIFPVSFRTTNKNGEGGYFNGLALNYTVMDGLDKEWGDASEGCLASVLHFVGSGAYARSGDLSIESVSAAKEGLSTAVQNSNTKLGEPAFKGAVISSRHP